MRSKDARMKATTEAIGNIKMLKINSWQEDFLARINALRIVDMKALRKSGFIRSAMLFLVYLFPMILPVATFSSYIGGGEELKYEIAVAALVLFNLMRLTLIQAPEFFADVIELTVSMKRIEKFIRSDEIQFAIKDQQPRDPRAVPGVDTCVAINGTFSWGFPNEWKQPLDLAQFGAP